MVGNGEIKVKMHVYKTKKQLLGTTITTMEVGVTIIETKKKKVNRHRIRIFFKPSTWSHSNHRRTSGFASSLVSPDNFIPSFSSSLITTPNAGPALFLLGHLNELRNIREFPLAFRKHCRQTDQESSDWEDAKAGTGRRVHNKLVTAFLLLG